MSELPAPPADDAGVHTLRLDADRTRDELAGTLDEIAHRLSPDGIRESASRSFHEHPVRIVASAVGAAAAIGGIIALGIMAGRRHG